MKKDTNSGWVKKTNKRMLSRGTVNEQYSNRSHESYDSFVSEQLEESHSTPLLFLSGSQAKFFPAWYDSSSFIQKANLSLFLNFFFQKLLITFWPLLWLKILHFRKNCRSEGIWYPEGNNFYWLLLKCIIESNTMYTVLFIVLQCTLYLTKQDITNIPNAQKSRIQ